jgi:hypothetical protein
MGDKGSKKGKDKSQKQKTTKQQKKAQTTRTVEVRNSLLGSRLGS